MPGKTFANKTPYSVSVQLSVRRGATPGSELAPVNFSLARGESRYVGYGDDQDPFLDGIAINAIDAGQMVAEQQFVFHRGSAVDNGFNTNDHVSINWAANNLTLSFSNA